MLNWSGVHVPIVFDFSYPLHICLKDWNIHLIMKKILWKELGVKKEHQALWEVLPVA